ncbi:MAG: CBS domain-containing protein [Gammaproteobacteria bacterium]|nr:CBS domain-containing protein [Gammaproteobacteria bacterium]
MASDTNLALNIDTVGGGDKPGTVARVAVTSVTGYLRDGSAPIVSRDCVNQRELAKEIARLKQELDDALAQAEDHFAEQRRETRRQRIEDSSGRITGNAAPANKPRLHADLKVADVMTRDIKTVQRNDPLSSAETLMEDGRCRHVIVLDEQAKLAGVISHRDMFYNRLSRSMGLGKYAHDNALAAIMAKQIMQTELTTVDPETALDEAAALMVARKIGCLPVLDGDAVVGIITESDFLSILAPGEAN